MHRSGTSATAHALATLGLQLPATPMGPAAGNELGHWGESEVVYELQRELTEESGTSWDDVLADQSSWLETPQAAAWVDRMAAALEREFPGGEPFVFKDPRISRQLGLWLGACDRIGVDPAILIVVRNPLEVARSLAARDGFEEAKGLMLWLRHNLEVERETRGLRRAFVSYDELFADWRAALRRVSADLAIELPGWDENAERRLDELIRPDHRHHAVDSAELDADPEVADWVKVASRCLAVSSSQPDPEPLDRVASELARADVAYGPILSARQAELRAESEGHARAAAALESANDENALLRQKEALLTERLDAATAQAEQTDRYQRERIEVLEGLAARIDEGSRRGWPDRARAIVLPGSGGWARRGRAARQVASWFRGATPRGRAEMLRNARAVANSPHFDAAWYLRQNPDVERAGMSPVLHYVRYGVPAGLDPAAHFDASAYREQHPDLPSDADPLDHFLRSSGKALPSPPPPRAGSAPGFAELGVLGADEVIAARTALSERPTSVSVVIPTHDRRDGVMRAIRSALDQSSPPLEVLVADDGSTDGTSDAVREEFDDEVDRGIVRITRSEERRGSSAARNAGLGLATGEIVAYLDSDNTWHPEYLEVMSAALAARSDLATAYCGLSVSGDDESPPETKFQEYDRDLLLTRNYIDLNAFVHRRRLFDQLGGFDEELTRLVDWDFVLRLTGLYPPATVRRALVNYYAGERGDRVTNVEDFDSNAARVRAKVAHERLRRGQTPFRIAYVLWDWPALSQTFVLSEIRELVESGYDVNVYFHTDPDLATEPDFEVAAHRVADAQELAGLLRAHGRTVIHSHFAYPAVTRLAWPAARLAGIPFTFMVHAVDVFHRANRERNRIAEVASDDLCARVFAIGEFHRSFLIDRGVPAHKISIARPAARLAEAPAELSAARLERKRRVVTCVSRFVAKKGLDDLVRAAALLPDAEFRLYGYGPEEEDLRGLASGLGNLEFMGPVDGEAGLAAALEEADVFALPCRIDDNDDMDGLPTVIGEAMAAGVPVVTTAISAIPDVVEDGVTGYLVPPRDPQALAEAVSRMLALDPGQLGAVVARAQERARETWNPKATVGRLLEAWGGPPLDIVLVTYSRDEQDDEPPTLEILRRVRSLTTTPFRLTIVDNASDSSYRQALATATAGADDTRLLLLDRNAKWGPAMNIAIDGASSDVVVYVCSREGFVLKAGWERAYVDHMSANRDVALAGHPISSPGFADGAAYTQQAWFGRFRNKSFAESEPERPFSHVQGGLFALRKAAYERCGRFSTVVAQDAVDVEFSYVVESMGWKLGAVPVAPSVTVKTRPRIGAHIDEHTVAAHPLTLESAEWADEVAGGRAAYCNVCTWTGPLGVRTGSGLCPECSSSPLGRLVYRYVASTALPYRRLRSTGNLRDEAVNDELSRMFDATLSRGPDLAARVPEASFVSVDAAEEELDEVARALEALSPGAVAVVGSSSPEATPDTLSPLRERLVSAGIAATHLDAPGAAAAFAPSGVILAERHGS